MSYNKFNLKMDIKIKSLVEGGFKSKIIKKNYLIKVLKYAHIARRSRYNKICKMR